MSILPRPELQVEVAFRSSPTIALDDPDLVWTDISDYVELDQGVSIQRRRANELDELQPGTLSLTLDNTGGRFTRLNSAGPYYPYVKHNRLIRVRALWGPTSSVNLVGQRQATGGHVTGGAGWHVPSGTQGTSAGQATATATGTTATLVCPDASAAALEVGDVCRLRDSADALKQDTWFQITGLSSVAGTTTITFSPAASTATVSGDYLVRSRVTWATGTQATAGARLALGGTTTASAGPDAIHVTAGLSYTWSCWVKREADAITVSPRILWYDQAGALLSETVGASTVLTTTLQQISCTATAPVGAVYARVAVGNESVFLPSVAVGYRAGVVEKTFSLAHAGSLTITQPEELQTGDGLLLWVNVDSASATVNTPTGWTAVGDRVGAGSRSYLFRRVASSTDAGADVHITSTGIKVVAIYLAYSGAHTTTPVHQSASVAETTYGTGHVTPNVTTTVANCWIVSAVFDKNSTTSLYTKPAGDTLRAEIYNTGANATVGAVSDNNAPVAAGTYGSKTWTGNRSTADATMWTVAIAPTTPAGPASATVHLAAPQFEQAAAVSAWAIPVGVFTRFVGHVDSWPTQWEGGVRALTTVTATDRAKLLTDVKVRAAITEQVLYTGPIAYYPLGEASGATKAGNIAATSQRSLNIVSQGTVTDEMLQFGAGTGPGTDAQPAVVLAPASGTAGKALRGTLTTPLGGEGVTSMTIAVCFRGSTAASGREHAIVGADDGNPTDVGATSLFKIYAHPTSPYLRARLALPDGTDTTRTSVVNWFDGDTHMVVAVVDLSAGDLEIRLYVDGVSQGVAGFPPTTITEFPELTRADVGCDVADALVELFNGTLSHAAFWNVALTGAEITDLWTAAEDAFAGDLPGVRAGRIATWAGLTATNFEAGEEELGGHPPEETEVKDALRLVAQSEGGQFFTSADGYSTLHARAHRTGATLAMTVSADRLDKAVSWVEDPALIANDVTVTYGSGSNQVRVRDAASRADYGVKSPEPLQTILATDEQAIDRAGAYLSRYREPISRPEGLVIEGTTHNDLLDDLLAVEIGSKIRVTDLPTGAPAPTVDLFIEGVGEDINHEHWTFTFDASPDAFDFGLILDDPARGLLDSNYLGF